MDKKIIEQVDPFNQAQDIRTVLQRYFKKHGFDLEQDNNAAELCDKIVADFTDLYHTAMFVRERVLAKKPHTHKDSTAIVAIGDWFYEFLNKH
jgi:hypothetical protein